MMPSASSALRLLCTVALLAQVARSQMPPFVGVLSVDETNQFNGVRVNNVTAAYAVQVVEAREFQLGIEAAIMEANAKGGIHGVPVRNLFQEVKYLGRPIDPSSNFGSTAVFTQVIGPAANPTVYAAVGTGLDTASYTFAAAAALGKSQFGGQVPTSSAYDAARARHQINLRMPFEVDTHLLAKYITQSRLRCKKTGVVYFAVGENAIEVPNRLKRGLEGMGHEVLTPIPLTFGNISAFLQAFDTAVTPGNVLTRPQCLVMMVSTSLFTSTMSLLAQLPQFNPLDYSILTPSIVNSADWRVQPGFAQGWYNRTYSVSHFPTPLDDRYVVTASLRRAGLQYLRATGTRPDTAHSVQGLTTNSIDSWQPTSQAMEGYLNTRLFIRAARSTSPTNFTPAAILDAVYERKWFVIDDWTLGPFSDGCSGAASLSPFACQCNVGTKRLFMTFVNTTSGRTQTMLDNEEAFEVGIASMDIPSTACSADEIASQVPLQVPLIYSISTIETGIPELLRISQAMLQRMYTNVNTATLLGLGRDSDVDIVDIPLPPGVPATVSLFEDIIPRFVRVQGYAALAFNPTDYETMKAIRNYTNFAPLRYRFAVKDDPLPPLAQWNPFFVSFFPALADYALTAVSYVKERHATSMGRIRILADTAAEAGVVRRAVHHYQAEPALEVTLFTNASHISMAASDAYPGGAAALFSAVNIAFNGATADDVVIVISQSADVLGYMFGGIQAAYGTVNVIFCTSEFVLYDAMRSDVSSASPATTLPAAWKFTSGLPVWARQNFTYVDPAESYSALIATTLYMASGFMFQDVPTSLDFSNTLYESRSVGPVFGGVVVGPFSNASCGNTETINDHPARDCQCTKGITRFYVRPIKPWFEAMVATTPDEVFGNASVGADYTFDMSGCGFDYEPLNVPPPDTTVRDALISAASFLLVIIVIMLIVVKIVNHGKRDNSCAPKDSNKPFAMVFTDIQSSTTLWARAPQHMAPAVDAHHEIIRGIIADFRGYEVKTIGDSFMVAFERAEDAVRFAMELQSRFFDHDWGTQVFDETYRELIADAELKRMAEEMERQATGSALETPIAQASPMTGSTKGKPSFETEQDLTSPHIPYDDSVWRGIRVRVGVHYGLGDIKLDPVSQGYDYYGTVVNTAARVEGVAHGGQICVTESVMNALTDNGKKPPSVSGMHTFDFGPQPLRGLDQPIGLTQVLPERFAARTYPPLRLDVEKEVEESEPDSEEDNDARTQDSKGTQGSRRSSAKLTSDDLVQHVVRRIKVTERAEVSRRVSFAKMMLESMMATSSQKWREATVGHLADKWRLSALRKEPGMGRYRRRLGVQEVNLVLLAYRVSTAAETRRNLESTTDGSTTRSSVVVPPLLTPTTPFQQRQLAARNSAERQLKSDPHQQTTAEPDAQPLSPSVTPDPPGHVDESRGYTPMSVNSVPSTPA